MFAARPLRPVGVRRPLRAAGAIAAAALVLVPWVYAVRELSHPKAVESHTKPTAIVWGGRVFSSKSAFATWFESTGGNYEAWARRHPGGLRTLDPKAHRKLSAEQRSARTTRTPAPTATVASSRPEPKPSEARTPPAPTTTVAAPRAEQRPREKPPAAKPTTTVAAPRAEQTPNENRTAAAPPATQPPTVTTTDSWSTALVYSLLVVVLIMLTLAFLPPRAVAPRLEPALATAQSYRLHLMVGASAITLGVFMSALLN
jgi:hypothetical protein